MPDRENFYTPENVDEEIEALLHASSTPTRDQCLLQDLSSLHKPLDREDERSLEKVLARLLHDDASDYQAKPDSIPLLHPQQPKEEGRFSFMQHTGFSTQQPQAQRAIWQRLSILAATLVIIVVVGSMLVILNIAHRATSTGGTTLPSATSTSLPKQKPGQIVYLSGTYDLVTNLHWSPDGKRIAATTLPANTRSEDAGAKATLQSWDALNHRHVLTYRVPGVSFYGTEDITWSPDGKQLAVATQKGGYIDTHGNEHSLSTDAKIYVFDAQTARLLSTFSAPSATATSSMAGSSGGRVTLLDSAVPLAGGGPAFVSVSWSPDNQWLAAAYRGNGQNVVHIWNIKTGHLMKTLTGFQQIDQVSWSPDGKLLATRAYTDNPSLTNNPSHGLKIWDTATWNMTKQYNKIYAFHWSPDGKQLALVDAAPDAVPLLGKDVRIVNVLSGQTMKQFSQTGFIEAISWSPDGSRVAVQYEGLAGKGNVILWDAMSGQQLFRFAPEINHKLSDVYQPSWSPDSKYIACVTTGENTRILIWVAQ